MSLQLFPKVVETITSNLTTLSDKLVLLVDDSFDFDDVQGSVAKLFPQNIQSVIKSKAVLAAFTMPKVSQDGISVEAIGPVCFDGIRAGQIKGFIIFESDVAKGVLGGEISLFDKCLICSDSISKKGDPGMITIDSITSMVGVENVFYGFNFSLMGA